MLPGYHRSRAKQVELKTEREAVSDDDGLDRARDLDADEVEARAERKRRECEAAERAREVTDEAR